MAARNPWPQYRLWLLGGGLALFLYVFMRYRQHKKNGTIIQAEWLTNFSIAKLPARSFFKLAKSRWEIENRGFNAAKNLYGMEYIGITTPIACWATGSSCSLL